MDGSALTGPVAGLLLAAGAGRRMGRPKALVEDWLVGGVASLRAGGCDPVVVVLGADAERARTLLADDDVTVVVAEDWADGLGASLRAGLSALGGQTAALVMLVDLPDVGAEVVRRLVDRPIAADTLARAVYAGTPGHPVLLGRDHWAGVLQSATGDRGARAYLARSEVELVECGDLATGRDVDSPSERASPTADQPPAE